MKQSLGLLEVSGLALAISCADVMAKAAAITLVGFEKTNGSGWMMIKITGDVASVQSAIITGASFAEQRQGLVAHKVIARPGEGILTPFSAAAPATEVVTEADTAEESPAGDLEASCNLCLDPACPRQKGEPRSLCLYPAKKGEM